MNNGIAGETVKLAGRAIPAPVRSLSTRQALLHWVDLRELEALREALVQGALPFDFLTKLESMAGGDLSHRFIEQNCRLFAALLMASEAGSFTAASPEQRERLLRVLAYVRNHEDAIPDYWAGGLTDDQKEVLAAIVEMGGLIQTFKAWRLRHQVPGIWATGSQPHYTQAQENSSVHRPR